MVTVSPCTSIWICLTPLISRRKHRRIAAGWLNARAVDDYTHVLDYEASVLVRELYRYGKAGTTPINPQPHAGRCSLNNMLTIVFGIRTSAIEDPLVMTALKLSREFMFVHPWYHFMDAYLTHGHAPCRNTTGPVSNLTDFVPLLQRIPNYMITRGKKLHSDLVETYGGFLKDMEAKLKRGETVPDCLAKTMILSRKEEGLDDVDMAILASAFMIGGVETVS